MSENIQHIVISESENDDDVDNISIHPMSPQTSTRRREQTPFHNHQQHLETGRMVDFHLRFVKSVYIRLRTLLDGYDRMCEF